MGYLFVFNFYFFFQYLGATTPDRVKKRTIELLYGWSKGLPHEPKIKEAYEMLKQQGQKIKKNGVTSAKSGNFA